MVRVVVFVSKLLDSLFVTKINTFVKRNVREKEIKLATNGNNQRTIALDDKFKTRLKSYSLMVLGILPTLSTSVTARTIYFRIFITW